MAYMSPEQIQGRPVDHRADLFSFGVLLFEMLTGQRPFGGQYEAALSYSIVNEEPPLLSEFLPNAPQKLSRLVSRLLEKDPAKRFSDSERLAGDLKGCLDQLPDSIETSKVTQSTTAQTQTGESFSSDSTSITINFPTLRSRNGILSLAGIVIVLALIGYWLLPSSGSPLSPTNNKIAVLPLESISTGPEDVQFTDGVHEELINRLAGISDLTVIARRSVLGFTPDERQDLQSIAEQLGVSVLMDGTVRRIGDQLRVSVQLIDVNNLGTLWSGSFEENIDNVFEIQSRIARQVANELQASLTEDEEQRLDDRPTDNPQAYQLYMQAREYLSRSRNEKNNLLFAEQLFKQALGEDRGFAQAWAMLAVTYSDLYWIHDHDPDQLEQMGEAAEWAFFHEPELFETYLAMGIYRYWSHSDNEQTLTFLKKTLQRFPNQPLLHRYLGVTNRRLGNWNQVEYHLNKAIEQDPRNVNHYNEIAFFYYLIREYDQALEMINRSIDLWDDTNTVSSAIKSWIVLERSGSLEGFETWFDQITSRDPIEVIPYFWGDYNYLKHDWEEAFRAFMNIESDVAHSHDVHHYPTAYLIALTLDSQGERVSALEKYEQVREHLEILLDKYPEDPRYRARLGNVYARIGEVKKAIQEGEKATELVPETQDAYLGAYFEMDLAMIYAWIDRKEQAIDKLEYLLSVPSMVHKNRLRIDPSWKPLWDHPRFQELIAGEDEPYLEGL